MKKRNRNRNSQKETETETEIDKSKVLKAAMHFSPTLDCPVVSIKA